MVHPCRYIIEPPAGIIVAKARYYVELVGNIVSAYVSKI
jgi:hypothetical protein